MKNFMNKIKPYADSFVYGYIIHLATDNIYLAVAIGVISLVFALSDKK